MAARSNVARIDVGRASETFASSETVNDLAGKCSASRGSSSWSNRRSAASSRHRASTRRWQMGEHVPFSGESARTIPETWPALCSDADRRCDRRAIGGLRKNPPLQSAGCNQRPSRGPRPFCSLLRWGPRKCTFRNPGCRRDRPGRDAFRCSRRPDSRYRPRERRTFGRTSRTIGERTTSGRAAPLEEPGASACPARRGPCRFGLGHCSCGRHARAAGWTAPPRIVFRTCCPPGLGTRYRGSARRCREDRGWKLMNSTA